jgi:proteasome lid subunit RPN8/RPN11
VPSRLREVILTSELEQTLRQHAERSAPNECVGALLGHGEVVVEVLELTNESPTPRTAFELSAREYLRAERHAEARGLEVLGFYHSHVDAPAVPSSRDLEHAASFARLIIVPVREGKAQTPVDWSPRRSTAPGVE